MGIPVDRLVRELKSKDPETPNLQAVRGKLLLYAESNSFRRGPSRLFIRGVLVVSGIALAIGGTAAASQTAMPGDVLYPVKLLSEEVIVMTQLSPERRAFMERTILERRFSEANAGGVGAQIIQATEHLNDDALRVDPESVAQEAESLGSLIEERFDDMDERWDGIEESDRRRLEEAYMEAAIGVHDARIRAEESDEIRDIREASFTER